MKNHKNQIIKNLEFANILKYLISGQFNSFSVKKDKICYLRLLVSIWMLNMSMEWLTFIWPNLVKNVLISDTLKYKKGVQRTLNQWLFIVDFQAPSGPTPYWVLRAFLIPWRRNSRNCYLHFEDLFPPTFSGEVAATSSRRTSLDFIRAICNKNLHYSREWFLSWILQNIH